MSWIKYFVDHADWIGPLIVAAFGSAMSIFIAIRQGRQITRIDLIGAETKDIAEETLIEPRKKKNAKKLFRIRGERGKNTSVMFPGNYNKRPLHQIVAGDYFALSTLGNSLGAKRLTYYPLSSTEKPVLPSGDIIFLCTPAVNNALAQLLPILTFKNGKQVGQTPRSMNNIPCWFCHDEVDGKITKKIVIIENGRTHLLSSPSEACYDTAASLAVGEKYEPTDQYQTDLAIFLRLKLETRRIYVLAGIHSYGTWAVAEYIDRLLAKPDPDRQRPISTDEDLAVIIVGDFVSQELRVERVAILTDYVWAGKNGTWRPWTWKAHGA